MEYRHICVRPTRKILLHSYIAAVDELGHTYEKVRSRTLIHCGKVL
jgi:hypothetical protein